MKAKCIDAQDSTLVKYREYDIYYIGAGYYSLTNGLGNWAIERFVLIDSENWVKCVDGSPHAVTRKALEVGKVYKFTRHTSNDYEIDGTMWDESRFVRIVGPTPIIKPVLSIKPIPIDINDWKTWRDSSMKSGDCACCIPKSQCKYHGSSKM